MFDKKSIIICGLVSIITALLFCLALATGNSYFLFVAIASLVLSCTIIPLWLIYVRVTTRTKDIIIRGLIAVVGVLVFLLGFVSGDWWLVALGVMILVVPIYLILLFIGRKMMG